MDASVVISAIHRHICHTVDIVNVIKFFYFCLFIYFYFYFFLYLRLYVNIFLL